MIKGIFSILLFLFIISSLMIGQVIYQEDIEQNKTTDIYNLTNNLDINTVNYSCEYLYNNEYQTLNKLRYERLNRIVCAGGEFILTTGIEITKFGIEFGYENPQYDYDFYFMLVKLWIYSLIIIGIIPIIIPLIALIYLIFIGISKVYKKIILK